MMLAFMAFMLPHLIFAVSWGNFPLLRASQIAAVGLLIFASVLNRRDGWPPSWPAIVLVAELVISLIYTVLADAFERDTFDIDLVLKGTVIITLIALLDRARGYGFRAFALSTVPVSLLIVAATAAHFVLNPSIMFGRHLFFGLHPNLGGEVLFGCIITVAFAPSRLLRLGVGAVILVLLTLLQSRAAFGGAVLVYAGTEALYLVRGKSWHVQGRVVGFGLLVVAVIGLTVILVNPRTPVSAADWVSDRILLLDNPYRGLNTGFAGRTETWSVALESFQESPLMGEGMDRSGTTATGTQVHNGYLALLAEYGLVGVGFFVVLAQGLIRTLRRGSISFVMLVACLFVFLFNARAVNLNVFPFLMWLLCLPWREDEPDEAAGTTTALRP